MKGDNDLTVKPYKMVLDDFQVGQIYKHNPPKTIMESDNNWHKPWQNLYRRRYNGSNHCQYLPFDRSADTVIPRREVPIAGVPFLPAFYLPCSIAPERLL